MSWAQPTVEGVAALRALAARGLLWTGAEHAVHARPWRGKLLPADRNDLRWVGASDLDGRDVYEARRAWRLRRLGQRRPDLLVLSQAWGEGPNGVMPHPEDPQPYLHARLTTRAWRAWREEKRWLSLE